MESWITVWYRADHALFVEIAILDQEIWGLNLLLFAALLAAEADHILSDFVGQICEIDEEL